MVVYGGNLASLKWKLQERQPGFPVFLLKKKAFTSCFLLHLILFRMFKPKEKLL